MRRGVCKNILYDNAIKLIDDDKMIVIDVREIDEIKEKILPKSINIPINELTAKITSIVSNKTQPILVYCTTGSRSIFACQILADLGYTKVYNLNGGLK